MKELLLSLRDRVKAKEIGWNEASDIYYQSTGELLTPNAVRNRADRLANNQTVEEIEQQVLPQRTTFENGIRTEERVIELTPAEKTDKNKIKTKLVDDPDNWEIVSYSISEWQQHTKEQTTKTLYAVKVKMKPVLDNKISKEEVISSLKELLKMEIKPFQFNKKEQDSNLDNNKLFELTGMELHLGKMAWHGDTGEDYDKNIASDRFNHIIEEVCYQQDVEKCGNALLIIGNDFFNSDTVDMTTTKGTQQQNDLRYKKLFLLGLKLYTKALITLKERFNNIEVRLCQGNHDEMASFYLYVALQQAFGNDNIIKFSDNCQETQCYIFGKCGIFFNHGDPNLKRLIKSIPAEFYKEWGQTIFRELHLGHLHKEVVVDDESGMITRRVGSPTGTDAWHYSERFIGATQKYQTFIWHKDNGLLDIRYINFDKEDSKKKLIKRM